jgi:hypothetical protein
MRPPPPPAEGVEGTSVPPFAVMRVFAPVMTARASSNNEPPEPQPQRMSQSPPSARIAPATTKRARPLAPPVSWSAPPPLPPTWPVFVGLPPGRPEPPVPKSEGSVIEP